MHSEHCNIVQIRVHTTVNTVTTTEPSNTSSCQNATLELWTVDMSYYDIYNSGILPEYKMLWTIIVQLCNSVSVQLLYSSAFSSPADPMPFKHCWWNSHGTSSVISIIHLFLSPDFCVENNLAGVLLWLWPPFLFNISLQLHQFRFPGCPFQTGVTGWIELEARTLNFMVFLPWWWGALSCVWGEPRKNQSNSKGMNCSIGAFFPNWTA